jgi:uncharacterized protein (UPF0276 family)
VEALATAQGIGVGHRPELAADLLARPQVVDFVEVVAEACMANPAARREANACRALWPVITHGVKLSLGSADGIDDAHAQRLGRLARELGTPLVSEHASFTRGRGREIGHLTRLPHTRAAIAVLARNVARARRFLPDVPFLLENVAATIAWPDDEMDEPTFYCELVRSTGCPLLLDVGNLYANAVNDGRDPRAELARFPLEHVAMLHVAGGAWEGGFYFDTHADPIPAPVFELVELAIRRVGAVPILLERDAGFGPFGDLVGEVERLRSLADAPAPCPRPIEVHAPASADANDLADAQRELADALVAIEPPSPELRARFGDEALARTRTILQRKRIDDALPHLPRLAVHGESARSIADRALAGTRRAPTRASSTDAWRILELALSDPALHADAELDALVMRARFHAPGREGALRPRRAPFVGRVRDGQRSIWAVKGPGSTSTVHLLHASARRGSP